MREILCETWLKRNKNCNSISALHFHDVNNYKMKIFSNIIEIKMVFKIIMNIDFNRSTLINQYFYISLTWGKLDEVENEFCRVFNTHKTNTFRLNAWNSGIFENRKEGIEVYHTEF